MCSTIRYFTIETHTHKKKEEGRATGKKVADEKKETLSSRNRKKKAFVV